MTFFEANKSLLYGPSQPPCGKHTPDAAQRYRLLKHRP
jgi:hypothetical protein